MPRQPPQLTFQKHIADFLIREHKHGKLEQADIKDTVQFVAEDLLWAFLKDTQKDMIHKLAESYGKK